MTNHSHLLGLLYASIGLLVLVILFMSSEEGSKVATIYFWQNPRYDFFSFLFCLQNKHPFFSSSFFFWYLSILLTYYYSYRIEETHASKRSSDSNYQVHHLCDWMHLTNFILLAAKKYSWCAFNNIWHPIRVLLSNASLLSASSDSVKGLDN